MRSTFSGIEIAKRSLFTQQAALLTTGHNIANANTQGYTRQTVDMVASRPIEAIGLMRSNVPGQMGQGVEFNSITRVRQQFLDDQYRSENKEYGSWTAQKDTLEKLQAITNEPSDTGLRSTIENFWASWQTLSGEPDNTTARAALKETALAMTDAFNHTAQQLSDLKNDLTSNVNTQLKDINSSLSQIVSLNKEIFRIEGLGDNANDLRDQRDSLVDSLSKEINISVQDSPGGYVLNMGSRNLVDGTAVNTTFVDSSNPGTDPTALSFDQAMASGDLKSGEIFGMITSRDTYLNDYEFQLNSMMNTMVQGNFTITMPAGSVLPPHLPAGTVMNGTTYTGTETLTDADRVLTSDTPITVKGLNGLHELGYTLDNPPQSGVPFFTTSDGSTDFTAANVRLNPAITANVGQIASSARVLTDASNNIVRDANGNETLVQGNNTIASQIADMQEVRFTFEPVGTGTPILVDGSFDEFYRAIVGQLGIQSQEADRQATNQKALVDQVDSNRQAVSGVSMDEEMANMVKYQHAYDAAARILTTYDQLLDKLINGTGEVGR